MKRREFLAGVAIVAMSVSKALSQTWFPLAALPTSIMNDGSSFPWSQPDMAPASIYVASTNTRWDFWEGWGLVGPTNQRIVNCTTFNRTTKAWTATSRVGIKTLSNDLHGVPAVVRDSSGYIYCFYGAHNLVGVQIAVTTVPDDPTSFVARSLAGTITFPKPFFIGSKLYMLYSTSGAGTGNQEAIAFNSATVASGVPSWGTAKTLFDSAAAAGDGFLPFGGALANGTDIHFLFAYGTTIGTNVRDVFYAVLDTTTGNVRNFDSSVTVVPASQPISLATARTSFRIVDQTTATHWGAQPVLTIDAAGASHVGYADSAGSSGLAVNLLHITNSGAGWSAPHTIATYAGPTTTGNACGFGFVPNATSGVDVYYPDGATSMDLTTGNMQRVTRSSGGTWSGSATLVKAVGSFGFNCAQQIVGDPDFGAVFTEVSADELTISGTLQGYYASSSIGIVGRTITAPNFGPATATLDPAQKSANLTLSNGSLTATCNLTNANGNIARTVTSHSTGKYYFEMTATLVSGNGVALGVINGSQAFTNHFLGETGNNSEGYFSSGSLYLNGAHTNPIAYVTGDVIGWFVDLDNKKTWFRKNNGTWNNSATQDPVSNTGGNDISAITSPVFLAVELDTLNEVVVCNFGATAYAQTQPPNSLNW